MYTINHDHVSLEHIQKWTCFISDVGTDAAGNKKYRNRNVFKQVLQPLSPSFRYVSSEENYDDLTA